jgi:hypothetical protein
MSVTFAHTDRHNPTTLDYTQRCLSSVAEIPTEFGTARVQAITYVGTECSSWTWVSVMVPGVWDSKAGRPSTVRARYSRTRELGLRVAQRAAEYVARRYGSKEN